MSTWVGTGKVGRSALVPLVVAQTALTSRVVVEQAKGVLAQHHGLSMDAAFDRLRRYSRNHNLRLAEVARQLATGKLDPAAITTPGPTGSRH